MENPPFFSIYWKITRKKRLHHFPAEVFLLPPCRSISSAKFRFMISSYQLSDFISAIKQDNWIMTVAPVRQSEGPIFVSITTSEKSLLPEAIDNLDLEKSRSFWKDSASSRSNIMINVKDINGLRWTLISFHRSRIWLRRQFYQVWLYHLRVQKVPLGSMCWAVKYYSSDMYIVRSSKLFKIK